MSADQSEPTGQDICTEFARLNNELINIRRDLEQRNAALERLAYHDTLTGLLNRLSILQKLDEWLQHVRRYNSRLAVAMVDIDHFKQVNDLHGHRIGDRVLVDLANVMSRSIRKTDFIGRYGGEEFLIIMPRTDVAGAAIMAERLRAAVEGTPMHGADGTRFSTTVSVGVAEYCDGDDEDLIISRADAALYRAKDLGRNKVRVSPCTDSKSTGRPAKTKQAN